MQPDHVKPPPHVDAGPSPVSVLGTEVLAPAGVVLGGLASIGAGAVHAGAIGMHAEHVDLARVFVVLAALQLGAGIWAVLRPRRLVGAAVAAVNIVAVGGWLLTRLSGISWIDGLETREAAQFADSACAGLGALAVLGVAHGLLRRRSVVRLRRIAAPGLVIASLAVAAMWTGSAHTHADGDHDHVVFSSTGGFDTEHVASLGRPYDPALPIDLGGFDGVTLQQQAAAENLVAVTLAGLPQWADYRVAEAAGFHSIGDAATGHEHFINWGWINDDVWLDPDHPESLVYAPQADGSRTLVSAMFMLPDTMALDEVPNIGGPLMQWHIHDNLCFTKDPVAPKVAGVTSSGGPCREGTVMFPPSPMIHVWIVSHQCGPFAALEGVGAGQILPDEERLCDHVHGSS